MLIYLYDLTKVKTLVFNHSFYTLRTLKMVAEKILVTDHNEKYFANSIKYKYSSYFDDLKRNFEHTKILESINSLFISIVKNLIPFTI